MIMMEQAAGGSALVDAAGQTLVCNIKRLDFHTQMMAESAQLVELINQRERDDGNEKP